ncbi:hypothetical protein D3C81_1846520 [compost metagenome]
MYSAQSLGGWMPMTKISTIEITERMAKNEYQPRPRFHGPMVGHLALPKVNRPSTMGMMKEKNRKITVHDTTMVYTGVSPMEITDEPQTNSTASVAPVQMAATGLR